MTHPNSTRRDFLEALAVTGLATTSLNASAQNSHRVLINDVTGLNPVAVARELKPVATDELQKAVKAWPGALSIGGGRYSMGGQIAAPDSLHIDMRGLSGVVAYTPASRTIRVRAGTTWRSIQDHIDPHEQSVKIMQSYSNFTVGGSVSVNCHGRYVGRGALVNSVRALQLVLPNGEVVEASRQRNAEIFRAAVGGYGGLGIITEVELDLEDNARIERVVKAISLEDYPTWFRQEVLGNSAVVLHNADLSPPNFNAPTAISWLRTDKPVTDPRRLVPRGLRYAKEQNVIWAVSELPGGGTLRSVVESSLLDKPAVVWRNFEASMDTASLEPRSRAISTYVLQEYFVPVANFHAFVRQMSDILRRQESGALNVSIRHAPADKTSLLTWAPTEVFCFVLYYKQRVTDSANQATEAWTRELVEATLRHRGRYYLPYRLHATKDQFTRAYPEVAQFVALKKQLDPGNRLRNMLWNRYL
ncbi:MAG: FAD-binding oxidoreductase [Ideonella sp.]|nr:FAD-binding oxidoreductase [Ideonella sp.]